MQVIKEPLPVDVYRNQNGDIVIFQSSSPDEPNNFVVICSAGAARSLCEAVLDMANQPETFSREDE